MARWADRAVDTIALSLHPLSTRRWGWERWALVFLILIGWCLRLRPLFDNRLHADEAWYGYWGLMIGRGGDPWLVHVPVDKPPLLPYLLALSELLIGSGAGRPADELAVRWPGLTAGILTVPLTGALAGALYRHRGVALVAALGLALSPFAILFSATAFTDPPMVALGLAAVLAAARGRPGWAGLWSGLACATKQSGVLWLPLVALVWIVKEKGNRRRAGMGRALIALGIVVGLVAAWDVIRVALGGGSFWQAGVRGYGGLRLIWPHEARMRLSHWLEWARYLFVSPAVNLLLLVGLPLLIQRALCAQGPSETGLADVSLVCFALLYLLSLWLWAFQLWDRYLLPLVPLLAILLGRVLSILTAHRLRWAVVLLLAGLMSSPARNAAHSLYPLGSDHGAYDGIDQVTAFLRRLPEGSVVYHHWLGWHYRFYLFGAPLYLAYWPTPAWLAQDVRAFGASGDRYIAFPSWEVAERVEQAIAEAGYRLEPVLTTSRRDGATSFTVYRVQPVR
ncbi:MAG: hypothetical protein N2508_07065 [Anaerolineae bacterium]|nr:hypothetical protein [Anaerolineae bacterium]